MTVSTARPAAALPSASLPARSLRHLLVVAALIAPCANAAGEDLTARYEDGLAHMNAGDLGIAIVEFQKAIQQDPNHLPARVALGTARLKSGDAAGAEKELRVALSMGASNDQVFPLLGNALLAQRKYAQVLETIKSPLAPKTDNFEIAVLRGRAHFELGEREAAGSDFAHATTLAPERPEPVLGQAMIALAETRGEQALALVERALRLAPRSTEAWFRKGEILRDRGDDAGALTAYGTALTIDEGALRVRLARAAVNLKLGARDAAMQDVEFVRRRDPRDLSAAFLRWQIYQRAGDAGAKQALADVSGKLSQYADETIEGEPLLLRIAALVHYANHDLVRSDKYLARFVELRPNDTTMQRLHGEVLLALGDAKHAIDVLNPLYRQSPDNLDVLLPLGQAYLQIGHYSEAESVFARAQTLAPNSRSVISNLALSRIGLGSVDGALTGLAEAVEKDQGERGAQMLLAVLQFKGGDRARALTTIEALAAREKDDHRVLNLLGVIRAGNGDLDAARAAFARAAELAPDYTPPDYNLAHLELVNGDVEAATARLEALVARNPRAEAALMALADIALEADDREAAARWLEKAVTAQPDAVEAEAQLVALRLSLGQLREALTCASHMVERHPEHALAVESLAEAEAANNQNDQAQRHFREAARYAGFDGAQLMRIAARQAELEDFAEARRTLQKAVNSSASDEARDALIRLEIKLGEYDFAANRVAALRADDAGNALADILSGELELQRGDALAAIKAYQTAQARTPSTLGALGLADAWVAANDIAAATKSLETWTASHDQDEDALHALALLYLRLQRLPEAQVLHERLLTSAPEDATLLADLARIYQLKGDPRARATAERALAAAPDSAMTLDTLGWIMVTGGDAKGGLELLRNAISRQSNPLVRYHLAQALQELGRSNEARVELRKILKGSQPAELIADVQRYYDGLPAQ